MNITEYTGARYDFRTYNCWHHVRRVRADAGLDTPVFDVVSPSKIEDAFTQAHEDPCGLVRADIPQNFDAVLMGCRLGSRIIWHAGVYFDGMVSHCELMARQVKLESLPDVKDRYPYIEFWR